MSKTGIFFGSSSGNTEEIANKIQELIGDEAEVHNVDSADADDLSSYENLILGSSTWGAGDLQDDFESFVDVLGEAELSGKKVAIFGLGDSVSYADTFANSIAHIYEAVKDKADVIGGVATEGYSYEDSEAVIDGQFVGLPIDEDNESDQTDERLENWINSIKDKLN